MAGFFANQGGGSGGDTPQLLRKLQEAYDRIAELERELEERPTLDAYQRVKRDRDEAREELERRDDESFSAVDATGQLVAENVTKGRAVAAARQTRGAVLDADGKTGWNWQQHGGTRQIRR